jgi:tRNA nucleotidyltransferase (CCA-adding enzyme)
LPYRYSLKNQNKPARQRLRHKANKKEQIYRQIIERGDCFEVKTLAVNCRDLIQAGIQPGPLLGAILERLVELVIDDPSLNAKEMLIVKALEVKDDPSIFAEKKYFFEK